MTKKMIVAATLCAGLLAMSASPASATPIAFEVIVDTSSLIPLVGTQGPFSLDFQLNGTGGNWVNVGTFDFGGGTFVGAPTTFGGAGGSLASAVTLSDVTDFSSELFQQFTPGARLSFAVTMTTNVATPTPDAFSFAILDGGLFNIPTTGLGDSLVLMDINGASLSWRDAQVFKGTGLFSGVTAAAETVPEPGSLFLLGSGLVGAIRWRQRRSGKSAHHTPAA